MRIDPVAGRIFLAVFFLFSFFITPVAAYDFYKTEGWRGVLFAFIAVPACIAVILGVIALALWLPLIIF